MNMCPLHMVEEAVVEEAAMRQLKLEAVVQLGLK